MSGVRSLSGRLPRIHRLLGLLLIVITTGCSPTIPPASITEFATGIGQARQQSQVVLRDANQVSHDISVEAILRSEMPGLTEDRFALAVDPKAALAWDNAFAGIQKYVGAIQSLLSPDKSGAFATSALALATELKDGTAKSALPPGVATAFTQLGEMIIQNVQQHDALAAMQKADPSIRAIFMAMNRAIGEDPRGKTPEELKTNHSGLMGTVWSNWQGALGPSQVQFATATGAKDSNARLVAINAFLAVLAKRDAELNAMASLKQSLEILADAHSAAARGDKADAAALIALVSAQLDQTQSLFKQFKDVEGSPATGKSSADAHGKTPSTRSTDGQN